LIRFEDKSVLSLNFCGFSKFFLFGPISKGGEWGEKPKEECRKSDTKTPNEMLMLPAFKGDIMDEIVFGIFFSTIIFTTTRII